MLPRRASLWLLCLALLAALTTPVLADDGDPADTTPAPTAAGVWHHYDVPGLSAPDGTHRTFYVRLPVGAVPHPTTAVLLLHGINLLPLAQAQSQGWNSIADAKGMVLIAGVGWKGSWAAGGCCGPAAGVTGTPAVQTSPAARVDDIDYINRTLAAARDISAADGFPLPLHSIAVAGFSNGGMLAARWACSRSDDVVAMSVSGPLLPTRCAHPVHLFHAHGRTDSNVRLTGGPSTFTHTIFPNSLTEHARLAKHSQYKLKLFYGGHRWGAPGQAYALTAEISAWIDHQLNGRIRAGA